MTERTRSLEKEVSRARADVHRDLEALGRGLRREEEKVRDNTAIIAGSAAAVGLLLGFGGFKNAARVFAAAAVAGAAVMMIKQR